MRFIFAALLLGVSVTSLSLAEAPTTAPATSSSSPSTQPVKKIAPADQVLDRMLKPTGASASPLKPTEQKVVDKTVSPIGVVTPDPNAMVVLREGTLIVDRTGRLTRSMDGISYEFSFESDGKALKDPPMVVLPNLNLANMETAIGAVSRDLRFRVTGSVTEYKGRNYILIDKAVVLQDVVSQF